jgi:hypothetical protein
MSPVLSNLARLRPATERSIVLSLLAALLYTWRRAPFLGQWDSFDYLKQVFNHELSPLGVGRPFFVGYNVLTWESLRGLFHLGPLQVETVMLGGVILAGALGVVVFDRFAHRVLTRPAARLAVLSLLLSPTYTVYAGSVMTEIPMLAAALGTALLLWRFGGEGRWDHMAGAVAVWACAVGIREQALVFLPAYLWIVWVRNDSTRARVRAALRFLCAVLAFVVAPTAILYASDTVSFTHRLQRWMAAIPRGGEHFWLNFQASALWLFLACPGAWVAAAGAMLFGRAGEDRRRWGVTPAAAAGAVCCLVLPVAVLWRDADVQIHPRYALVGLPAAVLICAALHGRRAPSGRSALVWALLQVFAFGLAQVVSQPFRQMQVERRDYARLVREELAGPALLIAGGNGAAFDYYRGIGLRPDWTIVWSGWDWDPSRTGRDIRESLLNGVPVYLCDGPWAWLNLEGERLQVEFLLRDFSVEATALPGLKRIRWR